MAEIKNISYIKQGEEIENAIMEIKEGNEVKKATIYLAFEDMRTQKKYLAYAMEDGIGEEKITCSLATFVLEGSSYVLEKTNNEEHNEVELPIINIIGLNNDKLDEEIMALIDDKFGKKNIQVLDVKRLKDNIDSIKISDTKPPKKVNIPVAIANGIKRFYLVRLNKLLKEIYKSEEMTADEVAIANEKLDKIDQKMDDLAETYREYDSSKTAQKSLEQIELAKENIEQAKNKLQAMTDAVSDKMDESMQEDLPEVELQPTYEPEEANLETTEPEMGTIAPSEEKEEIVEQQEINMPVETPEPVEEAKEGQSDEPSPKGDSEEVEVTEASNSVETDSEEILLSAINNVIKAGSDSLAKSFSAINQRMIVEIDNIYKAEIKRLIEEHIIETRALTAALDEVSKENEQNKVKIKEKDESFDELNKSSQALSDENETLQQQIDKLTREKGELTEDNKAKDGQIAQQNQIIDSLRDERNKNASDYDAERKALLNQIATLQSENQTLIGYKDQYERVASMFGGQPVGQPQAAPTQQDLIDEAVRYAEETSGYKAK